MGAAVELSHVFSPQPGGLNVGIECMRLEISLKEFLPQTTLHGATGWGPFRKGPGICQLRSSCVPPSVVLGIDQRGE